FLADASHLSRLGQIGSEAHYSLPAQSVHRTVRSLTGSEWGLPAKLRRASLPKAHLASQKRQVAKFFLFKNRKLQRRTPTFGFGARVSARAADLKGGGPRYVCSLTTDD